MFITDSKYFEMVICIFLKGFFRNEEAGRLAREETISFALLYHPIMGHINHNWGMGSWQFQYPTR